MFEEVNRECDENFYNSLSDNCTNKLAKIDEDINGLDIYIILEPCYHDMCVPFTGSQAWTRSIGYKIVDEWRPWLSIGQVVGYTQGYDHNLTFLTIKGVGHTVSEYKPQEAKMIDLEHIQRATTIFQRDKGNYYIFQIKPSLHFTQWDPGG